MVTNANDAIERTFRFGKVDYNRCGRRNCAVEVQAELEDGVFRASAEVWSPRRAGVYIDGQCLDIIAEKFPKFRKNPVYAELLDLWHRYHLNDMHAGTPEQEEALANAGLHDYSEQCEFLKSIGLYEVPDPRPDHAGETYTYGHAWLKEEIPEGDLERIVHLITTGAPLKEGAQEMDAEDREEETR